MVNGYAHEDKTIKNLYELLDRLYSRRNDSLILLPQLSNFRKEIELNNTRIHQIGTFPPDIISQAQKDIESKLAFFESRFRYLFDISIVTLVFAALLLLFVIDSGWFGLNNPNGLSVLVSCVIAVGFVARVALFLKMQRLKSMIFCLDCAKTQLWR